MWMSFVVRDNPYSFDGASLIFTALRERFPFWDTRGIDTIERAIAEAERLRERVTVEATDGTEAYAYPHPRGIAWGLNAAGTCVNILRGVRRPDGADEAVS